MTTFNYKSKRIGNVSIKSDTCITSIHTNRLTFKSLNQDSRATLVHNYSKLLGDSEIVKLLNDGKTWSLELVQTVIDLKTSAWNNGDPFSLFSIYENDTNQFVGSVSIKKELETYHTTGAGHANVIEIGFFIDKAVWGKGYGTEIAIAAKKYIKHAVGVIAAEHGGPLPKEIVATAHPENIASCAILKKTLKHVESEPIKKYDGNPRLFFFKPLKPAKISTMETVSLESVTL
ncbi:multifunctional nucleotidyltransferase/glutamate rich protein GrpB/ribosomal protein alanine acetyltransferase [Legionella moravica]|uniref:Multifunctional nucleotidyltransferase/glutamate rich protein GrpB/ribosomal protein alanine acetyltransferase n=1 Tax=Legionella moravica TaxID=39962 RepID=A0A378K2Z1_9GAMM|nr:GNAT family N-acetyltransferase [Legionella moravica]KTD31040.1 multifunctional nucleotidyltransferase/glutamate rich protein GrpB/ribosomal protein alanine acetyltransferase [Legionella moravica]STX63619.1 nucleotidyltransferase PLUS glutamate rich protein GrpB PLUS ribosomal protein alanine acetyltransferase [Legionella moravica]